MDSDKMRCEKKGNVSLSNERESTKQALVHTDPPRKLSVGEYKSMANSGETVASSSTLDISGGDSSPGLQQQIDIEDGTKEEFAEHEFPAKWNMDQQTMESSEQSSETEDNDIETLPDDAPETTLPALEQAPSTLAEVFKSDNSEAATSTITRKPQTTLIGECDFDDDDEDDDKCDIDGSYADLEKSCHEDDNDSRDISHTSLTESLYRRSSVFWEVEKEEATEALRSNGSATVPGAVSISPGEKESPSIVDDDLQAKLDAAYGTAHASLPSTGNDDQSKEIDGDTVYDDHDQHNTSLNKHPRIINSQNRRRLSDLPPPEPPILENEVSLDSYPGAVPVEGPGGEEMRMLHRLSNDSWGHVRSSTSSVMLCPETSSELSVTAVLVEDSDPPGQSRRRSFTFSEIVQASAVQNVSISRHQKVLATFLAIIALVTIVGLAVGLSKRDSSSDDPFIVPPVLSSIRPTRDPTLSPTASPYVMNTKPTLNQINERGVLRCGVPNRSGFSFLNKTSGEREGFEVDLCRAVAAAIFGNSYKIETIVLSTGERFTALHEGLVDVLIRTTTHTMERDIHQIDAGVGFTFSIPYLYDGLTFGGIPPYDACADKRSTTGECSGLKICVRDATTHLDILSELLPGSSIVPVPGFLEHGLINGDCNAIAGESSEIGSDIIKKAGYNGPYEVGANILSKDPLAIVTRDGDSEWSDFVNWVLRALLYAEQQGITRSTANKMNQTEAFGSQYAEMFINSIGAVGNYGEIYNRHLAGSFPRQGLNLLNTGGTGLMYSHPFGPIERRGPGPVEGGLINEIIGRGRLRCGISRQNGFGEYDGSEWTGLDADYCRALSASIFAGGQNKVDFVEITDTDNFEDLVFGKLDVMSGVHQRIQSDVGVFETSSGKGVSFSTPYFFQESSSGSRVLATSQDDEQWSSFVYWVVSCTFYAEEKGITKSMQNQMPIVESFGSDFARMFRDAILAVGNYGEMYTRNVESLMPRDGRNLLNFDPTGPQHFPLPIY